MVASDFGLGLAQHEVLPAGQCVVPQSSGGVRGRGGPLGYHQEHEKEPQLPGLRPLPQSGEANQFHLSTTQNKKGYESFNPKRDANLNLVVKFLNFTPKGRD